MAQNDMLKRYLDAGVAFTKMSRSRAEAIINDLVKTGEIQREHAQQRVDELVERSRRNTESLVDLVRRELRQQLGAMGLATKADVAKLEKRIDSLAGRGNAGGAAKAPAKQAAGGTTKKASGAARGATGGTAKKAAGGTAKAAKKAAGATKA